MTEADSKYFERYKLFEKCKDFVRDELKKMFRTCENQRTIEGSNRIFHQTLAEAKRTAFKSIETSVHKPWVVYMLNSYYRF